MMLRRINQNVVDAPRLMRDPGVARDRQQVEHGRLVRRIAHHRTAVVAGLRGGRMLAIDDWKPAPDHDAPPATRASDIQLSGWFGMGISVKASGSVRASSVMLP